MAATDRAVAEAGISRKEPEWITAIATALQTIAVIATLAVAYREWTSHELANRQSKIDNVLKLYSDEPKTVTDARDYIIRLDDKLHIIMFCAQIYGANASLTEKSAARIAAAAEKQCDPDNTFKREIPFIAEKTAPMRTRLSKVAVCDEVGLCDENLSHRLFCSDALTINEVLSANLQDIKFELDAGVFYAARLEDFVKACGAKDGGVVFAPPSGLSLPPLPSYRRTEE
jgi:hypothetical protein